MAHQLLRFPDTACISFLLTSFLLLTIVHLAKQQISISGSCQARCEARREKGNPDAFKFLCDDDKEACTRDCESCPKQVCDETTTRNSYENWHCPSIDIKMSDECKNTCNKFRDKGNPEKQTIYCNNLDTPEDQDECKSQCHKCSNFFCDFEKNELYCPWDKLDGDCKLECDKIRVRDLNSKDISHVGKFEFRCSEFYGGLGGDLQLCRNTLRISCPPYVQDKYDLDKYHCPAATDADLSDECKEFCDEHTKEEAKIVNCVEALSVHYPDDDIFGAQRKCDAICKWCKTPQDINYVCEPVTSGSEYFHCPKDAPKKAEPVPLIKHSYKGPCKHRCDVSQGGGPYPFELECIKFYETPEERQRCVQVCKEECGKHFCSTDGSAIIKCRGNEQKVKELEKEKSRKYGQKIDLDNQLLAHETEIDNLLDVVWGVGICLGILLIVFILACYCNKKKMKGLQQPQPHGQVPVGQAPGQMATNPSVGLMGLRGQVPRQPSRPFSTGPTPTGGQQNNMQVGTGVQGQGQMPPPTVGMWESK